MNGPTHYRTGREPGLVRRIDVTGNLAALIHHTGTSRIGELAFFLMCVTAFVSLPLISWHYELWSYNSVAGILPWSDSSAYHRGVLTFIHEGSLDSWNQRRPVNALVYVVLLGLVGGNFWAAMLLRAALVGAAIYFLARRIRVSWGLAAALASIAPLFVYVAPHVVLTSSEALGFLLGVTGFAFLWSGGRSHDSVPVAAGIALITISQLARPGAFLIVPLLVMWGAFSTREGSSVLVRLAQGVGVVAVLVLLLGVGTSQHGDGEGTPMGNFSHTLYGLAHGGEGWSIAEENHPASAYEDASAQQRAIYEAALQKIRDEPTQLLRGLVAGARDFIGAGGPYGFLAERPLGSSFGRALVVIWSMLGVIGMVILWRRGPPTHAWLVLVGWLGVGLSAPIAFPDGAYRALIGTAPFFAVPAGVVFSFAPLIGRRARHDGSSVPSDAHMGRDAVNRRTDRLLAVSLVAGTGFAILVAPALVRLAMQPGASHDAPACPDGGWPVVARVDKGSAHLTVVEPGREAGRTDVDVVSLRARRGTGGPQLAEALNEVRPGDVLTWSYNLARNPSRAGYPTILLTAPIAEQLNDDGAVLIKGCGREIAENLGAYRLDDPR